jgi:rhodanese-related sulfurtransferase
MKYACIAIIIALIGAGGYFFFMDNDKAKDERAQDEKFNEEVLGEEIAVPLKVERGLANLLDVRTDEEWDVGHAKGALHFELERLQNGEIPDIEKDKKLYVYCRSGRRAETAKEILERSGFSDVVNILSLSEWEKLGGEVVEG